jgi:hypothetical protein
MMNSSKNHSTKILHNNNEQKGGHGISLTNPTRATKETRRRAINQNGNAPTKYNVPSKSTISLQNHIFLANIAITSS